MKPKLVLVNILIVTALLVVIWMKVHWSVALLSGWMAYSLSYSFTLLGQMHRTVKATNQMYQSILDQLNMGAEVIKEELAKCQECLKHGKEGIRMGSIHKKEAKNCLLNYEKAAQVTNHKS